MVRVVGLEPTLLAERDFESRASTNFTTPAHEVVGAGEGIRTLDPDLGKVVLYP